MDFIEGLAGDWSKAFHAGALGIDIEAGDGGDGGVARTVGIMNGHCNKALSCEQIKDALRIAGISSSMGEDEVISRVFRYIKGKVRFIEDEKQLEKLFEFNHAKGRELLISPPVLLSMQKPMGDCDDFSMLACTMLNSSGVKCDFITVAADERHPEIFTHIYCLITKKDGTQVPFDASHGKDVGWETSKQFRKQIWPFISWNEVRGDMIVNNMGLGAIDWNSIIQGAASTGGKIALQLTQPTGYQTTGPSGTVSYVQGAGQGASGVLNIPGTSVGGISTSTILLGVGALALFMFLSKR